MEKNTSLHIFITNVTVRNCRLGHYIELSLVLRKCIIVLRNYS